MINEVTLDKLKALEKSFEEQNKIAEKFIHNGMNPISAIIIAGDILSRKNGDIVLKDTGDWDLALPLVGSYARFDWAYDNRSHTTVEHFYDVLPDLWTGSDPDDTNPEYLALWLNAFQHNGSKTIIDTKPLPNQKTFTIYRGQAEDAVTGISWSLKKQIAEKFAMTGGLRQPIPNGILFRARVKREHILAYLTGRSEEEIIVSPARLMTA